VDLPVKTRMALWWNRQKGKDANLKLALSDERDSISSVLVILPKNPEHSAMARIFIQSLQNAIGPDGRMHVRFVTLRQNLEYIDSAINDRLITYSTEHVNRWGLLNKSFLDNVFSDQPHAVIDLNRDFDPISASIVQQSMAPLRIGFYTEEKEEYYNILIDGKDENYMDKGYQNIQQLLGLL